MSLVHQQSCECTKSELDLFSIPPTQTSVVSGQWVEYHPLATFEDGGPIEFHISGTGEDYIDLSHTYLKVTAKVTKKNGNVLPADAVVAPVNNWLHSLFGQVDMSLNDTLITPSTNTYAYRAYMENLLSYGPAAKESQLTSELYYEDAAGQFDILPNNENAGDNVGQEFRRQLVARSDKLEMMGRLHLDMLFQKRYLLNGVDVKFRLIRSKNEFNLMCDAAGDTATKVISASLFVRKVRISSTVQMAHIKALQKVPAKYPLRRVETKVFSVPAGHLQVNQENLFLGQLPKRLVIGCVDNDAYNGSFAKSPFNFKNFNMNFLAVYVDGQQVPGKPFTPNFGEGGGCIRSYLSLFHGTGQSGEDEGNCISRGDYVSDGFALHVLDLSPDMSEGSHFELVKQGNIRLELHFGTQLPNTINVIVYAEFDNIIEIDRNRNVLFDFSA